MQVIQLRCKQATAVCSSGVMPANALHSTLHSQLSAMQGHSWFLSDTLVILTFVRFEILTLVMQMIQVSWVVMLCCWASTWQCLDLMWCWFQPNTCSRIRRCNIWTDVAWHLHHELRIFHRWQQRHTHRSHSWFRMTESATWTEPSNSRLQSMTKILHYSNHHLSFWLTEVHGAESLTS